VSRVGWRVVGSPERACPHGRCSSASERPRPWLAPARQGSDPTFSPAIDLYQHHRNTVFPIVELYLTCRHTTRRLDLLSAPVNPPAAPVNMWQKFYYGTKYAFVGNPDNYVGTPSENRVPGSNAGAGHHGASAPMPQRPGHHQDGVTVAAPTTAPFRPSHRAFLRGAAAFGTLPSGEPSNSDYGAFRAGGPSTAGGGSVVGARDAAVQEWRLGLGVCSVLPVGSQAQGGRSASAAVAVTSEATFSHATPAVEPRHASAIGSRLPPPPPRRRPQPVDPSVGVAVGGTARASMTHTRVGAGSNGGSERSGMSYPLVAGGCSGGAPSSSAAHTRSAGRPPAGAAGSSTAGAGAVGGGNVSDEEMLDTPLSALARRPRSGATLATAGAGASRVARRPRAATPRGTPSPSPTRRRRQSPSLPRGRGDMDQAAAPPDGTAMDDVVSTTSLGFASVRREITALKRELALTNSQQRSTINKIDSMAVMLENVLALVSTNRDLMLEVREKVVAGPALPPSQRSAGPPPTPDLRPDREEEDAAWIVELRPVLVEWLQHNFANAQSASDVWPSSATINEYLQNKIIDIMGVSAVRAVSMLQGKWRLPVRVKKNAQADAPNAPVRTVAAKRKTPAYRFLHRGVSHFYQRVGIMAVSTFSSRMHSEEGLGTLRRVRGTRTKHEVVFAPTEASDMLANDTFILDAGCRAALMHAAHAVFDRMRLRNFSEPGPSRGGPRNVVCRLAHVALLALKVRQHLQMRAAPVDAEGNAVMPSGLNVGHRDDWKREMGTLSVLLAVQGDRAVNGLRVLDGEWPGRAMADLAPPPPVGGVPVGGNGGEDGSNDDAADDGNDGDDDDDDASRGDGDGGDDGAAEDWMAGINEEMHPGEGEPPPEGDDGERELAAGDEDDEDEQSPAYRAARAAERLEFERAHAERRRRAFARTAEMLRLREAQQAAQRVTENADNEEGDEEE